ncbi:hypothetical protein Pse7367_0290 [Thalassoporum mexicanum PCC 7367]|uniref:hypothetical protein n=1 Tax=Thalassoporum mexicanum TaxID=3457544 RepID=UPI00029FB952|nr:hypothetical protein [Pseudanabaena sp. PCC 7367]AFY68604.1 hypothetical protein Pse7367_0290 [Pseudanabaena sp. PCC 7367]
MAIPMLKQGNQPISFSELMQRIEALGGDPNQLSLEEITAIAKSQRQFFANELDGNKND